MAKQCRAEQATDGNITHVHCMLDIYGYKHTLRIRNSYRLPLQQWLHERASMLRYMYNTWLVINKLNNLLLYSFYVLRISGRTGPRKFYGFNFLLFVTVTNILELDP
jgi:hypothetical protein